MSEFEHSMPIDASPDEVYAFVAKVENLPRYLPTTRGVQPQQGERVRVQGKAQGRAYDADSFFLLDRDHYRVEWGVNKGYYAGWLQVNGQGDYSTITVHLLFSDIPPTEQGDEAPDEAQIHKAMVGALESIKNFVEQGHNGGKEESNAGT